MAAVGGEPAVSCLLALCSCCSHPKSCTRRENERKKMTSKERREARYKRRKEKREEKKAGMNAQYNDFDAVFSYSNLYKSYKKCRKGVAWKSSTQRYVSQAPLFARQTYDRLQDGTFRSDGFYEFDIFERGKQRHIKSVTISERVVQRCLCDHCLVPAISRTFIYDNGASLQGKGYSFTINRLCKHLRDHYRKHGTEGYVLLFDFSKFFDNVPHNVIEDKLYKEFTDRRIIGLTMHFVRMFGDIGLGLGSQISQVLALSSADRLDHYVKEVLRIHGYGRYMDDGYLIHKSKAYLKECLESIRGVCQELGIVLNEKKTQIVKLSHGFTWLKARIFLSESGKVIKKIPKGSIARERRRLKSLRRLMDSGMISYKDAEAAWQSWQSYARRFDSHRTVQGMCRLYNRLFVYAT